MSEPFPHYPILDVDNAEKWTIVNSVCEKFVFSSDAVKKIYDIYEREMDDGLENSLNGRSSLLMENTYLPVLPDGKETGQFLSLDLGGTNFRVILLDLNKSSRDDSIFRVKYYSVPEPIRLGPAENLFDFLADCIFDFVSKENLLDRQLPLGFCFSFPMKQQALNSGFLVTWTKSFNCPGAVGKDAAAMLNDAIRKKGTMNGIEIVAILNDTTGTLVRGAFQNQSCFVGLILGTGCNVCYMENNPGRIAMLKNVSWGANNLPKELVIDTESGAFGDNGCLDFIKTEFDREVDAHSLLVGSYTFEKLFAGKFLGELCRLVLVKLVQKGALFDGSLTDTLATIDSLTTSDVSTIEGSIKKDDSPISKEIANRLGYPNISGEDVAILRYVCGVTSTRGALLVSVCLASLLNRMQRPMCSIAIDGSLYKHHPHFHDKMTSFIEILAPNRKFELFLAEDGSGKGAALVAAVAHRLRTTGY